MDGWLAVASTDAAREPVAVPEVVPATGDVASLPAATRRQKAKVVIATAEIAAVDRGGGARRPCIHKS